MYVPLIPCCGAGMIVGCTNPVLLDMLDLCSLSQAFSLVSALRGVAAMAGPPAAGVLVDAVRAPEAALYLCGGMMAASVLATAATWLLLRLHTRRQDYQEI